MTIDSTLHWHIVTHFMGEKPWLSTKKQRYFLLLARLNKKFYRKKYYLNYRAHLLTTIKNICFSYAPRDNRVQTEVNQIDFLRVLIFPLFSTFQSNQNIYARSIELICLNDWTWNDSFNFNPCKINKILKNTRVPKSIIPSI